MSDKNNQILTEMNKHYPFHNNLGDDKKTELKYGNYILTIGNADKNDMEKEGRTKLISSPNENKMKYLEPHNALSTKMGTTTHIKVKNTKTGESSDHHVFQNNTRNKPLIYVSALNSPKKENEHNNIIHNFLIGKELTEMYTFKGFLEEKKLTPEEKRKREEIALAIEKDNPNMPMDKKMAIATSMAKKIAESTEELSLEEAKIDIYVDGKYHVSTTKSKTNKEAREKYLKAYPQNANKNIKLQRVKENVEELSLEEAITGILHKKDPRQSLPMDGKVDKRYTTTKEFTGKFKPEYVVRFQGERIGSHETEAGAKQIAQNHSDEREKVLSGMSESVSLEEAIHPLDAHEILMKHGGRDADYHTLNYKQIESLDDEAKKRGYKYNSLSGKSRSRAFHDQLTRIADKYVNKNGSFKPEMKGELKESLNDSDEIINPKEAHQILMKNGGRDKNFRSLTYNQMESLENEANRLKFKHNLLTGDSKVKSFHYHLNRIADKYLNKDGSAKS